MRAAIPKTDPDLRRSASLPEGVYGAEIVHPFPGDLAGIRPLRPGRQEGAFSTRPAANDATRRRPQPLPPVLFGAGVMLLDLVILVGALSRRSPPGG